MMDTILLKSPEHARQSI